MKDIISKVHRHTTRYAERDQLLQLCCDDSKAKEVIDRLKLQHNTLTMRLYERLCIDKAIEADCVPVLQALLETTPVFDRSSLFVKAKSKSTCLTILNCSLSKHYDVETLVEGVVGEMDDSKVHYLTSEFRLEAIVAFVQSLPQSEREIAVYHLHNLYFLSMDVERLDLLETLLSLNPNVTMWNTPDEGTDRQVTKCVQLFRSLLMHAAEMCSSAIFVHLFQSSKRNREVHRQLIETSWNFTILNPWVFVDYLGESNLQTPDKINSTVKMLLDTNRRDLSQAFLFDVLTVLYIKSLKTSTKRLGNRSDTPNCTSLTTSLTASSTRSTSSTRVVQFINQLLSDQSVEWLIQIRTVHLQTMSILMSRLPKDLVLLTLSYLVA